jgi:hypothetical protein
MTDNPLDFPLIPGDLPPSLQYLLGAFREAIRELTLRLQIGMITLDEWHRAMETLIARYHAASFMAGQRSPLIGVTEEGYVYDYVNTQLGFLDNFALVIQSGAEWQAGWNARAEQYAKGIVSPYWKGRTKILPLPAMPGDLTTDCGQNCACLWDVVTIDEKKADYDCFWMLNASRVITTEHCQECTLRAREWNPLKVRDGILQLTGTVIEKEAVWAALKEFGVSEKHLPGQHDQKTHGKRGGNSQAREGIRTQQYNNPDSDPTVGYDPSTMTREEFKYRWTQSAQTEVGDKLSKMSPDAKSNLLGIDPKQKTITIYRGMNSETRGIETGDFVTTSPEYAKVYGKYIVKMDVPINVINYAGGSIHGNVKNLDIGTLPELIYAPVKTRFHKRYHSYDWERLQR